VSHLNRYGILLLLICRPGTPQSSGASNSKVCDTAPSLALAQAEERVIEKGTVDTPPLAKATRLRGVVRVEVCVSEAGEILSTKPLNGSPILIPAAIESAKRWRFQQGKLFKTVLDIDFLQGSTPAQVADEEKINSQYFAQEDKCRESTRAKQLDDAVKLCSDAVHLAELLPKERANERRLAYELLGHAYFAQQKFEDSLRSYKTELEIGLASLRSDEAELAYAYHDVALASHALGRATDASENYAKAETTLFQAREHIGLEGLKPKYTATLKQIREHYLILLQQTGQTAAAADLKKRMDSEGK